MGIRWNKWGSEFSKICVDVEALFEGSRLEELFLIGQFEIQSPEFPFRGWTVPLQGSFRSWNEVRNLDHDQNNQRPYWVSENSSAFPWGRTCWWRLWTVRCRSHYAKCLRVKRRLLPRFLDAENGLNCEWCLNSSFDLILWCANSDSQNLLVDKHAGNSLRVICQDLWGLIKVEFIILMSHAKAAKVSSGHAGHVVTWFITFPYFSNSDGFMDYHSVKPTLQLGHWGSQGRHRRWGPQRGSPGSPGRGNKKSVNLGEGKTKLIEHVQYAMWCCQIHI